MIADARQKGRDSAVVRVIDLLQCVKAGDIVVIENIILW